MLHHHQNLLTGLLSSLIILIFGTEIISLPPSYAADEDCATQDGQQEENAHQECTLHQKDTDDVDIFYAWATPPPAGEDSLMYALFPNLTRLQSAWEAYPLLSRVSFTPQQKMEEAPLDQIPTILHDRSLISKLKLGSSHTNNKNDDPLLSLFEIDDTPTILSQPMEHGSDYKLVKKIILPKGNPNAGEEFNGMLPGSHFTIEKVLHAFHFGAFSLVINKMQQRWNPIARMARRLEEEFGAMQVGVNLYLTPDVVLQEKSDRKDGEVRQGFEAHWDWMDGECDAL
mmetsp:Transcript_11307/g.20083  ORF Transcript_11307/g.20083 Transcript_11307/m.20083 type:complete len:285 (-) Transcript_11307:1291-2145(-)